MEAMSAFRATSVKLAIALFLIAAAAARASAQTSTAEFSNYSANVLVENFHSVGNNMIGLVTEIVGKRLSKKQGDGLNAMGVEFRPVGGQVEPGGEVYTLVVYWRPSGQDDEDAAALWESARKELEQALQTIQRRIRAAAAEERNAKAEQFARRRDAYRREMEDIVAKLLVIHREDADSLEQALEALSAAKAQLRQMELEQIGIQARRTAIERRIDELRKVSDQAAAEDPVYGELRNIVVLREKQLARVRELSEAAAISPTEVQNAEAESAEARIQLFKALREAKERAGAPVLQELNNQLSMIVVQAAELEEKCKMMADLVARLRAQTDPGEWAEIDTLNDKLRRVRNLLAETELGLMEAANSPLPELKPIAIRPLEEALLGDVAEAETEADAGGTR
jgi:hypothetical protein